MSSENQNGGGGGMTPELSDQKAIKAGKKCDHIGYHVGFGFDLIPIKEGGFVALTAQNCTMCGETFIKMTTLGNSPTPKQKESGIITN